MKRTAVLLLCLLFAQSAFSQKALYLDLIKKSVEKNWRESPALIEQWKKTTKPNVLWGYDAPGGPVYLAATLAFLYEQTHERIYAERAAKLLEEYGTLRETLPKGYAKTRAEYADGVPALSNFFYMPPYARAYMGIRGSDVIDAKARAIIERDLAGSVDFIFRFPEWGAHNRAMLRAEALYYAYVALSNHPHAAKWKQMSDILAADNVYHWEIEDASNYHPVWLYSLFSYADAAHRPEAYTSPTMRYYLEYYTKQIAPSGTVPDYGDAMWNSASGALRFVAIFEKGAAVYKSPEMKWAAASVLKTITDRTDTIGTGDAYSLIDAYRWADESITPQAPTSRSQEVLDDLVGRKIIFRDGWKPSSLYMLLNYNDEGEGGWLAREYLRETITVEEEKMHHGHSDENSIVLLMNKGSVLLHDAGYRSDLPSGKYGAWRQDYFHNRLVVRLDKRDKSQGLLEFLENSGDHREVKTQKIDFLNLRDVDMSRTRVIDDKLGYQWDRVVTYVRDPGYFVVVDGIKVLRPDYFTFANLWHGLTIFKHGEHYFDIATDSVPGFQFAKNQSLLVYFPETYAKTEGAEPISRHFQIEHAVYQTISSQYKAGDTEVFVTILVPHDRGVDPESLLSKFTLLPTSAPYKAVGIRMEQNNAVATLGVKVDLEMDVARENIRPRYLYDLGKVTYGDFETDAHFLYARVGRDSLSYSVANVLKLIYRGNALMEALPNTHGLQPDGGPDRVGYSKWRMWEGEVKRGGGKVKSEK
jgi:hypothetical protein